MFCLDIETLSTESNCVVLSAAIVWFDETKQYTFDELVKNTCFVKFDIKEQVENYNRHIEKSTIQWWKEQEKVPRKMSLLPLESDKSLIDGVSILRDYIKNISERKSEIVWTRGSIDQMGIDSLCKSAGLEVLFPYYCYRDIRTAIDLLKENSKRGYVNIPNFDNSQVIKHNPIHDVCLDVMMLLYG